MLVQKYAGHGSENMAAMFANGQVFDRVATTPALLESTRLLQTFLLNGASADMNINGSATPQVFEYVVPSTNYFVLAQQNLVIVDAAITPDKFGGIAALTNGILWQILDGSNNVKYNFAPAVSIKANHNFYHAGGAAISVTPGSDSLTVLWQTSNLGALTTLLPGYKVRITVRDNLTSVDHFQCSVTGVLLANDVLFTY